jgi:hypothetical protein
MTGTLQGHRKHNHVSTASSVGLNPQLLDTGGHSIQEHTSEPAGRAVASSILVLFDSMCDDCRCVDCVYARLDVAASVCCQYGHRRETRAPPRSDALRSVKGAL